MLVDAHAHLLPVGIPDLGEETGDARWPHLVADGDRGRIMRGTALFREVRRSCWDPQVRVEDMDARGVDVQVVSPVPVTLSDWAEPKLAARYLAEQNERIAEAVAGSAGRLVGLGAVPLQDADLAVAELHRITDELGLAGVEVGTRNGDAELDDPRLRPFLAEAAATGTPLFVHPVDGAGMARCGDPLAAFGIGMLADTALAAKALAFGGVLEDLPGLRVSLSHGGGAFPYMYPRLRMWATTLGVAGKRLDGENLDGLVRRLHVDTLVFDPALAGLLVQRYGADRVMFGTDDPFIPWAHAAPPTTTDAAIGATTAMAFYKIPGA